MSGTTLLIVDSSPRCSAGKAALGGLAQYASLVLPAVQLQQWWLDMEEEAARVHSQRSSLDAVATAALLLGRMRSYPDLIKAAISEGHALQICLLAFCPEPMQCGALCSVPKRFLFGWAPCSRNRPKI
jgi:hypothetical protein